MLQFQSLPDSGLLITARRASAPMRDEAQTRMIAMVSYSSRHPSKQIHQFRYLAALIGLVTGSNGMLDTMCNMIVQDIVPDPAQSGLNRVDLSDHVDAIPVLVHHLGNSPNLAFDAIQLFADTRLDVISHANYIPPGGTFCNPCWNRA